MFSRGKISLLKKHFGYEDISDPRSIFALGALERAE